MPKVINSQDPEFKTKSMLLFWSKGYNSVSPEDLSEHLEMSVSTVYNKLGKDLLFVDALQHYVSSEGDPTMESLRNAPDGREALKRIFYPLVDVLKDGTLPSSCFMINTVVELKTQMPEVNRVYEYYFNLLDRSFKEVLERMHRLGEIESLERVPEYVQFLQSMAFGLSSLHKIKSKQELYEHVDEQLSLLI